MSMSTFGDVGKDSEQAGEKMHTCIGYALLSCWLLHRAPAGKLPPNACTITGLWSGFQNPCLGNDGVGTWGQATLLS